LRLFEHPKEKLSHYSKRTVDIEYRFGFQGRRVRELGGGLLTELTLISLLTVNIQVWT